MQTLPPLWALVPLAHLAAVTGPLVVADIRTLRLPNALVLPGLGVLGWALAWAALVAPAVAGAGAAGAAALGGMLLAGHELGAIGMGDVKVAAWLGGLTGMTGLLHHPDALARGALVASVVALAALVTPGSSTVRIPFGPSLLAGFWVAVLSVG